MTGMFLKQEVPMQIFLIAAAFTALTAAVLVMTPNAEGDQA